MLRRARNPERRAKYAAELECPPLPRCAVYLWRIFWRIRRRKGSNGFSVSPIEWQDIDAFTRHSRMPLIPWEVEVIEDLDDLYLRASQPESVPTDHEHEEAPDV